MIRSTRFARSGLVLLLVSVAAGAEETTRHAYDVQALTTGLPNAGADAIGFDDRSDSVFAEDEDPPISGENLVALLKTNVAPDTWDTPPHSIDCANGRLVVTQSKDAHALIREHLARLRALLLRTVVVEADVVQTAPGVLDGTLLTADQARALDAALADPARGRLLATLRATGMNRQRFHASTLSRRTLVRDYDVEIAERQSIGDPVVSLASGGFTLDARPAVAPDGASVFLVLRFASADVAALHPFESGDPATGVVEQPEIARLQARTALLLPPGRAAVVASTVYGKGSRADWPVSVVVRASVQAEALPPEPPAAGPRVVRAFDVAALLLAPPAFPGPSLAGFSFPETTPAIGTAFVLEDEADPGLSLDEDGLIGMIRANVAPGSWDDPDTSLDISGSLLFARGTPEILGKLEEFLRNLASGRSRTVTVESWLVAMSEDVWRSRREALAGVDVPDAAWKEILADAAKDETTRLVGAVRAAGQSAARFHAAKGVSRSLVLDYDVEVAKDSSALDPVTFEVAEGVTLDVRPLAVGDGKQIQLDLRPSIVLATESGVVPLRAQGPRVQSFAFGDFSVETQVLVNAGQATLVSLATRTEGGKKEVLLMFVRARVE